MDRDGVAGDGLPAVLVQARALLGETALVHHPVGAHGARFEPQLVGGILLGGRRIPEQMRARRGLEGLPDLLPDALELVSVVDRDLRLELLRRELVHLDNLDKRSM